MIGSPEFYGRAEEPHIKVGGLELVPRESGLDPAMGEYFSAETLAKLNDLLIYREESTTYRRFQGDEALVWGFRELEAPAVSIGAVGLSLVEDKPVPAGWAQAESWLTFFDAGTGGQGVATRAYQFMVCFGLKAGLDTIYAAVRSDNDSSLRLHKRCGFVALGSFHSKGHQYQDMRLYHPSLGPQVIEHATSIAEANGSSITTTDLTRSAGHVYAMQARLAAPGNFTKPRAGMSFRPFIDAATQDP